MEQENINTTYTLEAEILTPVHVGAGAEKDWLENADFVFDKGKVYLLDHKKVIDAIGIDEFSSALTTPHKTTLKKILPGPVKDYASKMMECDATTTSEIRAFIRAGLENKPVIPGSSLKGALRSIIIHHLKPPKELNKNFQINNKIMGSSTEGDEFGRFFKVTDVSFDDTTLINSKVFNLTKNNDRFESGWKHAHKNNTKPNFDPTGFNTVYEVLDPEQKGMLTLSLAKTTWKNLKPGRFYFRQKKNAEKIRAPKRKHQKLDDISSLEQLVEPKTKISTGSIENLFHIINDHTRSYLEKEIEFFEKYNQAEHTEKILESLMILKNKIPEDNSYCIMRLAAGSGFHSITGDWKLESHSIDKLTNTIQTRKGSRTISRGMLNGQESAKSRKIAIKDGQFLPMGFIKLRKVTEAEIKAREEEERQKRKEERRQREIEAKHREEERLKAQKIQKLLDEADDWSAKKQFEEALAKVDEAAEINPDDTRVAGNREAIEQAREAYEEHLREMERQKALEEERQRQAEELKKRQEANKAEQEKEQQTILQKGLQPLNDIADYDEGRKYIEQYFGLNNQQIPEEQLPHLKTFIQKMKKQKPKDWKKVNKGNWKLVAKWVGKKKAQNWFDELK